MSLPSSARRAAALVAGGILFFLAACGSGSTQSADPSASSSDGASAATTGKTIVFSPLGLQIPAMKGLSEGVTGYGTSQGFEVIVQDPNLDPQKQVTDLQSVIESGKASGVWAIAVQPTSMAALVKIAQDKKVPLILNGVPEDYGLSGLVPGVSFSTIDYVAQGKAIGEELGKCINEKLGGTAKVIMEENAPGTAGKEELESNAKDALLATAPGAEIVTTVQVKDRAGAQTDIGAALQGNPEVRAVLGTNDEGALGAVGAFAAAGKELTCVTEAGGNDEALAAAKAGTIYAVVALQFQDDMAQSFDALVAMINDPTKTGTQMTVPQKVIKAGS